MATSRPSPTSLRVAELSTKAPTPFDVRPGKPAMAELQSLLGLEGLRKLSFTGQIAPTGSADWLLTGMLGATVVQPCVVTLEPVTTRIDVPVQRTYLRDFDLPDEPEVEMPEDDTAEQLGAWIDPGRVMQEELALALPEYPRKAEAPLEPVRVTEPGKTPMQDEDARPFAGLADLKAKLDAGSKDDE
ncbi:DUF177 domain-containing protein [Sulfitobacter sp. HNIBRBA3233]|uniref:YceD family protein n=1 Tax=Sulfitobacter marinivivus TaxID=3158558 RepID=UPI0032DE9E1A